MCLSLLTPPPSSFEHPWVAGPAKNHKKKANQKGLRGVSLDTVEPLNQLQQSPTSDLLITGEKQTPTKPPKSSIL